MNKKKTLSIFDQIAKNRRNSIILFASFTVFFILLGWVFGQALGYDPTFTIVIAIAFSAISALSAYYGGDKIVLAVSGAKKISHEQYPQLHNIVEEMCIAAQMPKPEIYVIADDDAPNAFATGRDPEHGKIAVTTALMARLNRDELQGVMAHELSHIMNHDILYATLTGVLVGSIVMLCDFFLRFTIFSPRRRQNRSSGSGGDGQLQLVLLVIALVLAILAPFLAKLIQLALSRQREFLADASGARLTRYPPALASALEKITADPGILEVANRATKHMYFTEPVTSLNAKASRGKTSRWFATHPPVAERIARLRAMT